MAVPVPLDPDRGGAVTGGRAAAARSGSVPARDLGASAELVGTRDALRSTVLQGFYRSSPRAGPDWPGREAAVTARRHAPLELPHPRR
jgi:hypothetical protein